MIEIMAAKVVIMMAALNMLSMMVVVMTTCILSPGLRRLSIFRCGAGE